MQCVGDKTDAHKLTLCGKQAPAAVPKEAETAAPGQAPAAQPKKAPEAEPAKKALSSPVLDAVRRLCGAVDDFSDAPAKRFLPRGLVNTGNLCFMNSILQVRCSPYPCARPICTSVYRHEHQEPMNSCHA